MNALGQGLAPLAAEFAGNARLRWGVWLMLGIALFYCILVQSDRVAVVHDDYVAETEHMVKAETILRDRQDWPQLLEAERETYRERVAGFWQAETTGLAQAKLQAALADVIDGFDLRKPRIRSGGSQPVPGLPEVWRVQARLDGGYRPELEPQVLHALATYPKKLIVDRLDLRRRGGRDSHVALILSAYFVGVEAGQKE